MKTRLRPCRLSNATSNGCCPRSATRLRICSSAWEKPISQNSFLTKAMFSAQAADIAFNDTPMKPKTICIVLGMLCLHASAQNAGLVVQVFPADSGSYHLSDIHTGDHRL